MSFWLRVYLIRSFCKQGILIVAEFDDWWSRGCLSSGQHHSLTWVWSGSSEDPAHSMPTRSTIYLWWEFLYVDCIWFCCLSCNCGVTYSWRLLSLLVSDMVNSFFLCILNYLHACVCCFICCCTILWLNFWIANEVPVLEAMLLSCLYYVLLWCQYCVSWELYRYTEYKAV